MEFTPSQSTQSHSSHPRTDASPCCSPILHRPPSATPASPPAPTSMLCCNLEEKYTLCPTPAENVSQHPPTNTTTATAAVCRIPTTSTHAAATTTITTTPAIPAHHSPRSTSASTCHVDSPHSDSRLTPHADIPKKFRDSPTQTKRPHPSINPQHTPSHPLHHRPNDCTATCPTSPTRKKPRSDSYVSEPDDGGDKPTSYPPVSFDHAAPITQPPEEFLFPEQTEEEADDEDDEDYTNSSSLSLLNFLTHPSCWSPSRTPPPSLALVTSRTPQTTALSSSLSVPSAAQNAPQVRYHALPSAAAAAAEARHQRLQETVKKLRISVATSQLPHSTSSPERESVSYFDLQGYDEHGRLQPTYLEDLPLGLLDSSRDSPRIQLQPACLIDPMNQESLRQNSSPGSGVLVADTSEQNRYSTVAAPAPDTGGAPSNLGLCDSASSAQSVARATDGARSSVLQQAPQARPTSELVELHTSRGAGATTGMRGGSQQTCVRSPLTVTVASPEPEETSVEIRQGSESNRSSDMTRRDAITLEDQPMRQASGTCQGSVNMPAGSNSEPSEPMNRDDVSNFEKHKAIECKSASSGRSEADLHRLVRELNADKTLSEAERNARRQALFSAAYFEKSQAEAKARLEELQSDPGLPCYSSVVDPATGRPFLGCKHYARNCKIQAICCGMWFVCRLCHDEALSHVIDRHRTEMVMCMKCKEQQPVSKSCRSCGTVFAKYFCDICKLYDNTPEKSIYHCPKCGICRVGKGLGQDNFHCDKCNACVSIDSRSTHYCLSRSLDANCPICNVYLFTSTESVVFMRCGHTMHAQCFDNYTKKNFTCPLCNKSLTDMSGYYEQIDRILERERMPPDYDNHFADIYCYDCNHRSRTKYHFVYHKCQREMGGCGGYNTRVISSHIVVPAAMMGGRASDPPVVTPFRETRRVSTSGPHPPVLPAERDHMSIEIVSSHEELPQDAEDRSYVAQEPHDAAENGDYTEGRD